MTVRTSIVGVAWQWRRLVLIVAVLALGSNLALALRQPLYGTEVRALVQPILPAEALVLRSRYPQEYRRMQFVQYVLLDLAEYVEGHGFAAAVAARHEERFGTRPPPGAIAGALSAQQVHRTLRIGVVTGAAESTYRIAVATAAALEQHGADFVSDEAGQPRIEVAVITDPASPQRLIPWRGLLVAVARAFAIVAALLVLLRVAAGLRRTLDTSGEVTALLSLPVLGTVPAPDSASSTIFTRWIGRLSRPLR